MSGIGLVNAARTTQTALDHFRCGSRRGISGVAFSGTSGGRTYIGDVTVPARYTEDGTTWLRADAAMLATVRDVVASGSVRLERAAPLGDPACACQNPDAIKTVSVSHAPQIIVGGDGLSSDPFGGRAWPCIPGGGDGFGCVPCRAHRYSRRRRATHRRAPHRRPNNRSKVYRTPPREGGPPRWSWARCPHWSRCAWASSAAPAESAFEPPPADRPRQSTALSVSRL